MKTRLKHTLYLVPAVLLLLIWVVSAPGLVTQRSIGEIVGAALATALVAAWCITLFFHAVLRDKP